MKITRLATLSLLLLILGGCLEGPTGPAGPEGPRGETGIAPTAEDVAANLVRDHLATIQGPQGDPGTPATGPTAEEVAAVLVRDHLTTITGPTGQDGTSPTASSVAQDLVANYLPQIRGPAGAYDAVDANGTVIGRVTGLMGLLWSETHQAYFWAPRLYSPGADLLALRHPPILRIVYSNSLCADAVGEVFVDINDQYGFTWVEPLVIGRGGSVALLGSALAPRADGVNILSVMDGSGVCTPVNQTRNDLIAFDSTVTFANWVPPMTLVPATQ